MGTESGVSGENEEEEDVEEDEPKPNGVEVGANVDEEEGGGGGVANMVILVVARGGGGEEERVVLVVDDDDDDGHGLDTPHDELEMPRVSNGESLIMGGDGGDSNGMMGGIVVWEKVVADEGKGEDSWYIGGWIIPPSWVRFMCEWLWFNEDDDDDDDRWVFVGSGRTVGGGAEGTERVVDQTGGKSAKDGGGRRWSWVWMERKDDHGEDAEEEEEEDEEAEEDGDWTVKEGGSVGDGKDEGKGVGGEADAKGAHGDADREEDVEDGDDHDELLDDNGEPVEDSSMDDNGLKDREEAEELVKEEVGTDEKAEDGFQDDADEDGDNVVWLVAVERDDEGRWWWCGTYKRQAKRRSSPSWFKTRVNPDGSYKIKDLVREHGLFAQQSTQVLLLLWWLWLLVVTVPFISLVISSSSSNVWFRANGVISTGSASSSASTFHPSSCSRSPSSDIFIICCVARW
jgi:hypothetical protein